MDILSFALGMVTVAVIALVVVAVAAFVKARKNEKTLEEFMVNVSHELSHIQDNLEKRAEHIDRTITTNLVDVCLLIFISL